MVPKTLSKKNQSKFLGVMRDERSTWKPHVSFDSNKISKQDGSVIHSQSELVGSYITL